MCHETDAQPPRPPGAGAAGHAADIHLTSADGTVFLARRADPARARHAVGGRRAAVVVLPDMRGLHGFYKAFADRLAETGLAAVAIDYYGRVLPDGPREGTPEEMFPLVLGLQAEQVAADVRAATDLLRAEGYDAVFTLGFCVGGSHSWNQSAFDTTLAGCIGFYGKPDDCRPYVDRMSVPMLLLGAGADFLSSPEDFHAFDAELSAAGVEHTSVLYDGLPHAFFDGAAEDHRQECDDAWHRVLHFIDEHTAQRLERLGTGA